MVSLKESESPKKTTLRTNSRSILSGTAPRQDGLTILLNDFRCCCFSFPCEKVDIRLLYVAYITKTNFRVLNFPLVRSWRASSPTKTLLLPRNYFHTHHSQESSYTIVKMEKEEKVKPWKKSEAKKLLTKDILTGVVDDEMDAAEVWLMRYEYSLYEYKNFKINLRNLREVIRKARESAARSSQALQHDLSLTPSVFKRTKLYWPDSDASRWLEEDMKREGFEGLPKKELWLSREAYQEFSYKCFYNHVRQAVRSGKEKAYWSFINDKKKTVV